MGEISAYNLVSLSIPVIQGLDKEEIDLRIEQESVANMAVTDFLKNELSFDDLLDVLEFCEIDIDDYLGNISCGLQIVGVL